MNYNYGECCCVYGWWDVYGALGDPDPDGSPLVRLSHSGDAEDTVFGGPYDDNSSAPTPWSVSLTTAINTAYWIHS